MSSNPVELGKESYFNQTNYSTNTYPVISSIVSSQIPLSNVFNGQNALVESVGALTANGTQTSTVQFSQIQQKFDFKMYKLIRPKVIFSSYLARQQPENGNTVAVSSYTQQVQFKIDYDPCCIGSMMLLLTLDLQVRDILSGIDVYGYSFATGNDRKITISKDDIKSIQFAYGTDFIYHYIKSISLGWANTGGNSPIFHQEVPIEIAKIYHSLLVEPGMSETIKRMVREDMFIIGHDPHRQYGSFSFALKNPASIRQNSNVEANQSGFGFSFTNTYPSNQQLNPGSSEIAMYWNDAEIKEIGYGGLTNNDGLSEMRNIQATFVDPRTSGNKVTIEYDQDKNKDSKIIKNLNLNTTMYWKFGTVGSSYAIRKGSTDEVQFGESTQSIHIVSDINKFLEDTTDFSGYACAENENEKVYLIPVLVYNASEAKFVLLVVGECDAGYTADAEENTVLNAGDAVSLLTKTNSLAVQTRSTDKAKTLAFDYSTLTVPENTTRIICGIEAVLTVDTQAGLDVNIMAQAGEINAVVSFANSPEFNDAFTDFFVSNIDDYNENGNKKLTDFVHLTATQIGSYLLKTFNAMSPFMQHANIAYMNLEVKPYEENDLALNSIDIYRSFINNKEFVPTGDNAMSVYKYNASMLANQQNEENYPAIKNVDGMSIHTYRTTHGIVDFYFPLQFLFICQGINTSFPHYACAAQSLIVRFQFCNPLAFINTSISVNPLAIDPLDFSRKERILKNRVKVSDVIQSNTNNMKFVLFYMKYVWVPHLNPILAGYKYYSWITNNYEKLYKSVDARATDVELCQFNKANFYTNIWMFFVNTETLYVDQNSGTNLEIIPINVNKYHLELWDMMRFVAGANVTSQGTNIVNLTDNSTSSNYNSAYNLVPVDSLQMITASSINMTDQIPFRAQMFAPYALYEHTGINSSLKFNNLIQIPIDSVFYQEGFPNCMYSPAYAPNFTIKAYLKSNAQDFGVIIIPQYKNVTYITKHVCLMKYQTSN